MMEKEISSEKLPVLDGEDTDLPNGAPIELPTGTDLRGLSEEEITERIETILMDRIKSGNKLAIFQLGQLYFEQNEYDSATKYFEKAAEKGDLQAMFQLGIIYYDGMGSKQDHKRGFELMMTVASSTQKQGEHLLRAAQYNVGRAYFQGYGVRQSGEEANRYWLLAADDGNPKASIKAQSTLGMYYSLPDTLDLKKAFFWHSEACGNGSLESQGALGVMFQNGLGVKKNMDSAFICFRQASERGNVYAMGNLVAYYYKRRLYTKTVELAARVALLEDVAGISEETDCVASFVAKGIAIGCFYYARLLAQGLGIKNDPVMAKHYYSKCYQFDPDTCAKLQASVQHGEI